MSISNSVRAVSVSGNPREYEDVHVHAVYDEIASHFSSTRYKPWPIIAEFLSSLPTGWVGLDSGTGNGKYLPLPYDRPGQLWTIGLDRSRNLLRIAQGAGGELREVVWGDVLDVPWRHGAFDYAISIATIHHLSTSARRRDAVKSLLHSISPDHGRALIYVWAVEQDSKSKRVIPSAQPEDQSSTEPQGVDVFVPWVLSDRTAAPEEKRPAGQHEAARSEDGLKPKAMVYDRFYHMFAKGELEQLATDAAQAMGLYVGPRDTDSMAMEGMSGVEVCQSGWERSNYYVELRRWRT